jgi:hypothetical protein
LSYEENFHVYDIMSTYPIGRSFKEIAARIYI